MMRDIIQALEDDLRVCINGYNQEWDSHEYQAMLDGVEKIKEGVKLLEEENNSLRAANSQFIRFGNRPPGM